MKLSRWQGQEMGGQLQSSKSPEFQVSQCRQGDGGARGGAVVVPVVGSLELVVARCQDLSQEVINRDLHLVVGDVVLRYHQVWLHLYNNVKHG